MSALLNYKLEGEGHTVVLIHGLFGNLDNLGLLARDLKTDHQVLSIDLRNHGQSFHSQQHDYTGMAQDVANLLEHLAVDSAIVIGHSMGGKVAMKLTEIAPKKMSKLIVLDMAPVSYHQRRHDNVLAGLKAVIEQQPSSRAKVMSILAEHIELEGVRQFLSKSIAKGNDNVMTWRFNVASIESNYWHILGWQPIATTDIPTLFIKGSESDYLMAEHQPLIQQQFSQAKAHVIANTGHWLHAEKPVEVLRAIRKFID
ncbi:alpha/beta fold hydrolase [Vibrio aestuarianus]|uniref:alpha/beta fold hydrolase n=1 Tax=Vibrio aestuarianus TaxID=28171 RepID=UPI0015589177|nr:alpha/beta fold hydrolase [Vibrio aestuarianus]NGZ13338.1 alpha/beta fold hydrolase [Vibrio aestuarianus]NKZ49486.1 alpha/beta fold hydrolase [Vibrio aestuarianus]